MSLIQQSFIMRLTLVTLFLFYSTKSTIADGDHKWCYKDPSCDANHWKETCQNGKVQSPVDFNDDNLRENKTEIRLRFNKAYFDTQPKFYIRNNGHTIQVQLTKDLSSDLRMDGDGLKGTYIFSQLHFHWGSNDHQGSEHTIRGKSSPLELHFVHYNEIYKGLLDAIGSKSHRSLAVVGIMFELSKDDNGALKPIIEAMSHTQNVMEETIMRIAPLNITALLPKDLGLFRYYGSLTTPGCFEVVHWNVLKKPVPISRAQLEAFRNIKDSDGDKLVDNYRPTLPLGGRKVTEFTEVEIDLKPEPDVSDNRKPAPDKDYDEEVKVFDAKKAGSGTKKSGAGTLALNTVAFVLSLGALFQGLRY